MKRYMDDGCLQNNKFRILIKFHIKFDLRIIFFIESIIKYS